ncbi:hypothetical protein H5410_046358 [Solanum commersonii]|uniref:Uncharacterized protein n=1 Tax=Solanum commersonii TaxID=4109 RepID=A0A9J5XFA9_SOLCO|nr:hypothetical protein H5410_046358 [Solanum commersonii]
MTRKDGAVGNDEVQNQMVAQESDLRRRGFDPTIIYEYHANTPGHSTENCWTLKRVIEKLIEDKVMRYA